MMMHVTVRDKINFIFMHKKVGPKCFADDKTKEKRRYKHNIYLSYLFLCLFTLQTCLKSIFYWKAAILS